MEPAAKEGVMSLGARGLLAFGASLLLPFPSAAGPIASAFATLT